MTVRIGINPLTWTNDDMPELGKDTPLEVCLREAREAGFVGVELGNKFPRDPEALARVLAEHDLALASGWYSARLLERPVEREIELVEPHRALLSHLGCTAMVLAETARSIHGDKRAPLSRRPVLRAGEWASFGRALTELGVHLRAHGMDLAYHHHMGTVVQSTDDIDALMDNTGESVRLLLDTGHLTYAGGSPHEVVERYGPRIAHVHCKDVRKKVLARVLDEDTSFLDAVLEGVFTVPGDGSIEYESLFVRLKVARYDGWLVVEAEQDPATAHPLTYAKMGYENTASMAAAAGLFLPPQCAC